MKTLIAIAGNFLIYAFLWATYIGYRWWTDGGLSEAHQDPRFYLTLAASMLAVSVFQAWFEARDDREERRKLEGEW